MQLVEPAPADVLNDLTISALVVADSPDPAVLSPFLTIEPPGW